MSKRNDGHKTEEKLRRGSEPHPSPDISHTADNGRLHILVVDDNEDAAESQAMLLRMEGHEVRTAYEGPRAMRIAMDWCPQAIVQDIGMPGMSGYHVARALRQYPVTRHALLIAVSGTEDRGRSRAAGFDHHLVKPVDFDELRKILVPLIPETRNTIRKAPAA